MSHGGHLSRLIHVLILLALSNLSSVLAADPSTETLPTLTKAGEKWGADVVDNSVDLSQGRKVKKPPFVEIQAATSLALAAAVMDKATNMDLFTLSRDADFQALLDLVQNRLEAGEAPTFQETQAIYTALNAKEPNFGPVGNLLNFVLTLGPFFGKASKEERHTEGHRVLLPPLHPQQKITVDFVNGVQTPFINGLATAAYLGQQLDLDVNHIHNEAGPLPGDFFQTIFNNLKISNDLAAQRVAQQVLDNALIDRPYLLICHSQGASICAQGLAMALNAASVTLQDKIKKQTGVLSLGGFTTDTGFPSGITLRSICAPRDPVCSFAQAIDFTRPPSAIKAQIEALADSLTGFDHSITDIYVPSQNNRKPGRDVRDLVSTALAEIQAVLLTTTEPVEVHEVSTRSGWTGDLLATRRTWTVGGQQFVEVRRFGVTKCICPITGVSLLEEYKVTWNVWKFVPLQGYFITPGATPPIGAVVTVKPDNVMTESCRDIDPLRRFSSGPANCPLTIVNDPTFTASTSPNFTFPLCFSTHSCGLYDPASPYLGQTGYTAELQTGCVFEECPAAYGCPDLRV